MKAEILCGGKGTRLSEETSIRPKPMVDIGGLQKEKLIFSKNHTTLFEMSLNGWSWSRPVATYWLGATQTKL